MDQQVETSKVLEGNGARISADYTKPLRNQEIGLERIAPRLSDPGPKYRYNLESKSLGVHRFGRPKLFDLIPCNHGHGRRLPSRFAVEFNHVGFGNDSRFFPVLRHNINEYLVPPFLAIHGPFSSSVRLAQNACAECATVSRYESDCRICHGISNLKTPGYEQNLLQPTSAPNAPLTTILNAVCPSNS